MLHRPAQSPVLTAAAAVHGVVVVVSLDHGDVALHHPVVSLEDTQQAGDTLAHAAAPRHHLHARPELVLVDAHQDDGQCAQVGHLGAAEHHVLHRPTEMVATVLGTSVRATQLK